LQKAKIKRNATVLKFLGDNKSVFEKDYDLIHFYKKLMSDHAQSMVSAEDLEEDETAFSNKKLIAKKEVCEMAKSLCEVTKVAFLAWGDRELYKKTKVGYLHFFRSNDFYTEERVKELHKLLHNHIVSLSPEYIIEAQLDEFKEKIKTFVEIKGSSSINDRPPKDVAARLKADLKVLEKVIYFIFTYAEKYRKINPQFFEGLWNCNKEVEDLELGETLVAFSIVDAETNQPLPNVKVALSKCTDKQTSNLEGNAEFISLISGRSVATFMLKDYKEITKVVKIKPGIKNSFQVSLKKE
jgi:hypothetical protein